MQIDLTKEDVISEALYQWGLTLKDDVWYYEDEKAGHDDEGRGEIAKRYEVNVCSVLENLRDAGTVSPKLYERLSDELLC